MEVEFTFLGTGTSQGVPIIGCTCEVCQSENARDKRLRSSLLVKAGGATVVIDTGPDFRQQCLRADVDALDAVVFTHEHKDHVAGLDDIRPFNFRSRKDMPVFATERVEQTLQREFKYIFEADYPGVPRVQLHRIAEEPFAIEVPGGGHFRCCITNCLCWAFALAGWPTSPMQINCRRWR